MQQLTRCNSPNVWPIAQFKHAVTHSNDKNTAFRANDDSKDIAIFRRRKRGRRRLQCEEVDEDCANGINKAHPQRICYMQYEHVAAKPMNLAAAGTTSQVEFCHVIHWQ